MTGVQTCALPISDSFRTDHPSIPNNPLLAESLYLTRYIEKAGSGTQAMIEVCRDAGLPEPDFEQRQGSFVVTLWRDWLTPKILDSLDLNERQRLGINALRLRERLTNAEYQEMTSTSRQTASRDLEDLVKKNLLARKGRGRGTYYVKVRRTPQK